MGIGAMISIPLFSLSILLDYSSGIRIIFLGIVFMIIGIVTVSKLYKSQLPERPKTTLPVKYDRKPYNGSNPIGVAYLTDYEIPSIFTETVRPPITVYNEFYN
jgi:hypothetical protein